MLYSFKGHADGGQPRAGLIYSNGLLYGTTTSGGASGHGTVFVVSTAGIERVLYSFEGGADGANPRAALLYLNGVLYGTTLQGGSMNLGTVFRIDPTTGAERVLHSFVGVSSGDGANPAARLIAVNGNLYSTTSRGGYVSLYGSEGTIFEISTSGSETVLYAFGGGSDGGLPFTGLTEVNGQLYGTTSAAGGGGVGTFFVLDASGFEFPLYSFGGGQPTSGLLAVNGSLYGTTAAGTEENVSPCGCSTVYKMSLSGVESVLHKFVGGSADGETPEASLIALNGLLYGTTASGGGDCDGFGCGTVFELSTSGEEHVLHSFIGGSDGGFPQAGLTAVNGTLYGTTAGSYDLGAFVCGTVFEVTPSGVEHVLYRFKGGADGCIPDAPLVAVNGELYGTTYGAGGDRCLSTDCGTVFEVSMSGQERVLHSFTGGADGASPKSLTFMNGVFYGTTDSGGISNYPGDPGYGTVFQVSPSGQESLLYRFQGGTDGGGPMEAWLPSTGCFMVPPALVPSTGTPQVGPFSRSAHPVKNVCSIHSKANLTAPLPRQV